MQDISERLDNNTLMSERKKPLYISTKDPAKDTRNKNISSYIKIIYIAQIIKDNISKNELFLKVCVYIFPKVKKIK